MFKVGIYDVVNSKEGIICNLQSDPFESDDVIMELAIQGYVEKEMLDVYLKIKQKYQFLVMNKIVLYDIDEARFGQGLEYKEHLRKEEEELNKLLMKTIKNDK